MTTAQPLTCLRAVFLLRTDSFKRGIVSSTALAFVSKALSFLLNPAIAFYFGAGPATDVYFFCLAMATVASGFITSLSVTVVIPHSMHLAQQKGDVAAQEFLNLFLYLYAAIALGVLCLVWAAPAWVLSRISRFDARLLTGQVTLIRSFAVLVVLTTLSSLLVDIVFANRFFTVPMLCSVMSGALSLALLASSHRALGLVSIPIAMSISAGTQVVFLLHAMRFALKWRFCRVRLAEAKKIRRDIVLSYFGNATSAFTACLPNVILSGLGAGVLSALAYAQSAAAIPGGLITTQYASVAGIKFNELCARREYSRLNEVFISSLNLLIFLLVPCAAVLVLFDKELIQLLYCRGAAKGASLAAAASMLSVLALQAPLIAVNTFASRLFMADRQIAFSVWYQIAFSVVFAFTISVCTGLFGVMGYPWALITLYAGNVIACLWLFYWRFPFLEYSRVLKYLGRVIILNCAIFVPTYALGRTPGLAMASRTTIVATVYLLALIFANSRLRLNADADRFVRQITNLWKSSHPRRSEKPTLS